MIGDLAEYVGLISIATQGGLSPAEILALPKAQGMQLRSLGLLRQNVKLRPAGGSSLRDQVREVLGEEFGAWMEE